LRPKAVLFDLDGTLLPMDQDAFVKDYFFRLAGKMASFGYDVSNFKEKMWFGIGAMLKNSGGASNEDVFFERFTQVFGDRILEDKPRLHQFYLNEFQEVRHSCGFDPDAALLVDKVRAAGYTTVLATNPIFPAPATESRIRWAGLQPGDFVLYTTYENSTWCKPQPGYYREILDKLGLDAAECVMVGNDVDEDMVAEKLGMKVFLVTRDLINAGGADISRYPNGSLSDALEYILSL